MFAVQSQRNGAAATASQITINRGQLTRMILQSRLLALLGVVACRTTPTGLPPYRTKSMATILDFPNIYK